jgi:hypothetical protein
MKEYLINRNDTLAFPVTNMHIGMTVRDYFAAKAMQGMMVETQDPDCNYIAEVSYRMADAMMKAREA